MLRTALIGTVALVSCLSAGSASATQDRRLLDMPASGIAPPLATAAAICPAIPSPVAHLDHEQWLVVPGRHGYLPVLDRVDRNLRAAQFAAEQGRAAQAAATLRRSSTILRSLPTRDDYARQSADDAARSLDATAGELDRGIADWPALWRALRAAQAADVQAYWSHASSRRWLPISFRPDQHLDRAVTEMPRDPRAAATDLREANAYLRVEDMRHATFQLRRAEQGIDRAIVMLDNGRVDNRHQIDDVLLRADRALAQAHYDEATPATQRHHGWSLRRELRTMAGYVHGAALRVDDGLKQSARALDRDVASVASDVRAATTRVARQARHEFRRANDVLHRVRTDGRSG
jgi:hypothetical protein